MKSEFEVGGSESESSFDGLGQELVEGQGELKIAATPTHRRLDVLLDREKKDYSVIIPRSLIHRSGHCILFCSPEAVD